MFTISSVLPSKYVLRQVGIGFAIIFIEMIILLVDFPVSRLIINQVFLNGIILGVLLLTFSRKASILDELSIILVLLILSPSIPGVGKIPVNRLDEMVILGAIIGKLLRWGVYKRFHGRIHLSLIEIVLIAMMVAAAVSIVHAWIVAGNLWLNRYITEYILFFKYFYILFTAYRAHKSGESLKTITDVILTVSILFFIIGMLQYMDLFRINKLITPFYTKYSHIYALLHSNRRIMGTMGNPNDAASFEVLVIILIFYRILHGELDKKRMLQYGLLLFMNAYFLMYTASRTGTVSLLIGSSIMAFFIFRRYAFYKRNLKKLIVMAAVILILLYVGMPRSYTVRMEDGMQGVQAKSVQGRLQAWKITVREIKQSPIVGWAFARDYHNFYVDNEYLLILKRYGIIGFSLYLGLFGSILWKCFQLSRKRTEASLLYVRWVQTEVFVIMSICIMAGIFYKTQLMPIFLMYAGLAVSPTEKGRALTEGAE